MVEPVPQRDLENFVLQVVVKQWVQLRNSKLPPTQLAGAARDFMDQERRYNAMPATVGSVRSIRDKLARRLPGIANDTVTSKLVIAQVWSVAQLRSLDCKSNVACADARGELISGLLLDMGLQRLPQYRQAANLFPLVDNILPFICPLRCPLLCVQNIITFVGPNTLARLIVFPNVTLVTFALSNSQGNLPVAWSYVNRRMDVINELKRNVTAEFAELLSGA